MCTQALAVGCRLSSWDLIAPPLSVTPSLPNQRPNPCRLRWKVIGPRCLTPSWALFPSVVWRSIPAASPDIVRKAKFRLSVRIKICFLTRCPRRSCTREGLLQRVIYFVCASCFSPTQIGNWASYSFYLLWPPHYKVPVTL